MSDFVSQHTVEKSDSQACTAYKYRAFSVQVSECLSQDDYQRIVFLELLPCELEHKLPLNVLMQLEMHGKLLASRPDNLAKLLESIARYDLAEKVREFIKQQQKGRVVWSLVQRLDHPAEKLSSSLEISLLQFNPLLELVEKIKEKCDKRVQEVIAATQAMAESCEQTVCSDRDQNYEFVDVSVCLLIM